MPHPAEEGEEPVSVGPVWLAKGKAIEAFRSAIAGNEEIENLVQGFQPSDEEQKEPDQLLRDKFISGINNERLMSKLLDNGHRDQVTKEVVPFKTMLQIAKNFEQYEKAKAVMQQVKGATEQVNYTGTS